MSVIDHGRRYGDDEQGAVQDRREGDGSLWGFAYDRIEGVVHLTLAFTLVGAAAVILSSALFGPGAPLGGPVEKPVAATQPNLAPAIAAAVKEAAAPVAPVQQAERASAEPVVDSFLDARPMTENAAPASAPAPLAPPSADMREKLASAPPQAPADESIAPAPPAPVAPPVASASEAAAVPEPVLEATTQAPVVAEKAADEPKADAGGRMARCYLKLSGRVQNSGSCRVDHTGESVIFHLPGKALEIAHGRGRVWTATLGGRNLGKVYKNKGSPCWGAKGFYACENG